MTVFVAFSVGVLIGAVLQLAIGTAARRRRKTEAVAWDRQWR